MYSSEGASLRRGLLMEGSQEVAKSEHFVVLTPSISPARFFSSLAESKKVRNQLDPNQDHKCGLICCMLVPCQSSGCSDCTRLSSACAQLSCSPRGPRKQNPQRNTTRARLFLNSQRWAQPSAGSQVTTQRLHNQTPSAVSVLLKIPWYKVRMFSWHGQIQTG